MKFEHLFFFGKSGVLRKMMDKLVPKDNYIKLLDDITVLLEEARSKTVRQVNCILVQTYWEIGSRIVKGEQRGAERAGYGEELLKRLSQDLTKRFGRGFNLTNLKYMRQFYLAYPKSHALRDELSWTHYRSLMRIEDETKRAFYEVQCIKGNWSTRELDRQINSLLYERVALSRRKEAVLEKANQDSIRLKPEDEIKDPYVLEFLGLKDEYSESDLEKALIDHLEDFLLELGTGFCFVARQKRITIDNEHYFMDLVFYHRALRCLVIIDLKIGKFDHRDVGQMNFYLNYIKDRDMLEGENDPIGIILCSDKSETIARYALGGLDNKIFASKYQLKLPLPEELEEEIRREQQRLREQGILDET